MSHKFYRIIPALILLGATTSCHHKDLCFDHIHDYQVNVVFDWRNAPDGNPESMALYMFDRGETSQTIAGGSLRYIFSDRYGGQIRIPFGYYDGLCMNSDNTDWAHFRHTDDVDNFEIYTQEVEQLTAYGLPTRSIPRAEGTEDERVVAAPGMAWSSRSDSIALPLTDDISTVRTITLYPEEIVCHYTVDVLDVDNISYVSNTEIDGTLSGMAEGYLHGRRCATDNHITLPFTLDVDRDARTLHSEFLTFGECGNTSHSHTLTIYMYLTDNSKWYYTFDVTDQVKNAPDPRHVHIVVRGLPLPKPLSHGGGLRPDVEDWQTVEVPMQM